MDKAVPEMKLPLLCGIFGSAFCASLSHYYNEIRPFVTSVSMLKTLDTLVIQRSDSLVKVHPFDPASVPNFAKGLDRMPSTCPDSLRNADEISLMVRNLASSNIDQSVTKSCRMRGCPTT